MDIVFGIIQEGLIYSIMALGVYISLKILDFPDLTADGSFPLGMAVSTVGILNGFNPFLCLVAAFFAGAAAGAVTGLLHVKLKIKDLLSGIITMTALYSINYTIVGKPNEFLDMTSDTVFSIIPESAPEWIFQNRYLIVSLLAVVIIKILLDLYLKSKSGFLLRCSGDNPTLVITLGKNPGRAKILGLSIGNGLVALSGALNLQYIKSFNVSAGTGTLVMGLAAVILGMSLFKKVRFIGATASVIFGMILYKACISAALMAGLAPKDTNLIVSVLFIVTLIISNRGGVKKWLK